MYKRQVLSRADLGIAMGAMGSDAAIEAADVVLMDDQPSKIATAIRIAKKTLVIVKQNIVFALAIKGLFLIMGAFGAVSYTHLDVYKRQMFECGRNMPAWAVSAAPWIFLVIVISILLVGGRMFGDQKLYLRPIMPPECEDPIPQQGAKQAE